MIQTGLVSLLGLAWCLEGKWWFETSLHCGFFREAVSTFRPSPPPSNSHPLSCPHPPACSPHLMRTHRSNKRRISQVEDMPSSSVPSVKPTDRFDTPFNQYNADVLLRTCDGGLFAVWKTVIIAHSSVLEDMFDIPQPPINEDPALEKLTWHPDQKAPRTLLLVQMTETTAQLRVYLRWIHQDTHKALFHTFNKHWLDLSSQSEELYWLLDCARKFETVTITETVFKALTWQCHGVWPETLLALGILFNRRDIVKLAIKRWAGASRTHATEYAIYRIWPCLIDRLSPRVFPHLSRAVHRTLVDHLAQSTALAEEQQALFVEGQPSGLEQGAWRAIVDAKCKDFLDAYEEGFPPLSV